MDNLLAKTLLNSNNMLISESASGHILYFINDMGNIMCHSCANINRECISGFGINYADNLYCDKCDDQIF